MKWILAEPDESAVHGLANEAGLHPIIAALMVNRGVTEPAAARRFLSCDISGLSEPAVFSDMEKAVSRVKRAITGREKIIVYGDYDVDGVTAAALLFLALCELDAEVDWYIPDRLAEGYGLNPGALERIKQSGFNLVITVDCGIGAYAEAELAVKLGLDLIITDHHELPGRAAEPKGTYLPAAYAILHPRLLKSGVSTFVQEGVAGLTGVGVAFKFVQALMDAGPDDPRLLKYLDLVTLGTIADVGRMTGENRAIVRRGLELLSSAEARPGLLALKAAAGLNGGAVGVGTVGFVLGPRINAGGRLENAGPAFRLLTTKSHEEAAGFARTLDALNRERQAVEEEIHEEALEMSRSLDIEKIGALVLASEQWHPGVVGIVASRIAEEFYRPAALIAIQNGVGKGSARSIPGFDLYSGLMKCSDLLLGFGGHAYAAGFTVSEENICELGSRLSRAVLEGIGCDGFVRSLKIDRAVSITDLTLDLVKEMDRLAPFGQGNPEPRFGSKGLDVLQARIVGGNHLRLKLRQSGGAVMDAIGFNLGRLLGRKVREGGRIAAVFTPRLNTWNGRTVVELEIRDVKVEKV